jgi:hypothetical protein
MEVFMIAYRDKKVVIVFVRFRAPLSLSDNLSGICLNQAANSTISMLDNRQCFLSSILK